VKKVRLIDADIALFERLAAQLERPPDKEAAQVFLYLDGGPVPPELRFYTRNQVVFGTQHAQTVVFCHRLEFGQFVGFQLHLIAVVIQVGEREVDHPVFRKHAGPGRTFGCSFRRGERRFQLTYAVRFGVQICAIWVQILAW
jgi:hypothetical protein